MKDRIFTRNEALGWGIWILASTIGIVVIAAIVRA